MFNGPIIEKNIIKWINQKHTMYKRIKRAIEYGKRFIDTQVK